MNLHLEDKVALVTGSKAGIGFAIAAGLAAEGARVIVNGRTEKRVQEAVTAIAEQHPKRGCVPSSLSSSLADHAAKDAPR
jgi:NAD(P)-dependent dehydrogenase (short-subunit alcohol dehydrogenase family)